MEDILMEDILTGSQNNSAFDLSVDCEVAQLFQGMIERVITGLLVFSDLNDSNCMQMLLS